MKNFMNKNMKNTKNKMNLSGWDDNVHPRILHHTQVSLTHFSFHLNNTSIPFTVKGLFNILGSFKENQTVKLVTLGIDVQSVNSFFYIFLCQSQNFATCKKGKCFQNYCFLNIWHWHKIME